ncbi:Rho-GTPase-activating protein 8 [Neolecta irregularis DAH-3]|uniref:Rho-GTPase-activating protein 8 n=1 Tax=Neolecta irregularis (strain DAH-3) TaxID=1198029 RepID=A0A1U7LUF3_NEOID|nr:Rho-GTPase-activating protein 8 [Neolecta irregularis DAH-3]|eukprot:OLL26172.1 Rho-GTPase-activating protein 8 [Neolecta irregularis DAH-3]
MEVPVISKSVPTFCDSFWAREDYAGTSPCPGSGVDLMQPESAFSSQNYSKSRAECEESYGNMLQEISNTCVKAGGFMKDEGATTRKAFDGLRKAMDGAGNNHLRIANNIDKLVIKPFGQWVLDHKIRVQTSHDALLGLLKLHDRQLVEVKRLRTIYFNKCRLIEDAEEEKKYAFQEPSPERKSIMSIGSDKSMSLRLDEDESDENELIEIGDIYYSSKDLALLIAKMMDEIPRGEVTVRILGTYTDVYNGSDMVNWIENNMLGSIPHQEKLPHAESIGQDLVDNGLLRLVGNMGSSFANSSVFKYQWRKKAEHLSGKRLRRGNTISSASGVPYVGGYLGKLSATLNPYPDETPQQRLHREAAEADETYKNAVVQLDKLRTSLEEAMLDHYKFMERCESDRLKALKSVVLDFSAAISNVIHGLKASVDDLLLYHETIQPENDLRFMIESNRTGPFIPKAVTYENYYNIVDEQNFGVDLDLKARQDGKRVPILVSTTLTYMDMQYPTLENDTDVQLATTHRLRSILNPGKSPIIETLALYEPAVVVSVLKLWLLELPDSLIPSSTYDLIKTIYLTHGNDKDPSVRIATLDAIITHFGRFIEITSSDEKFVAQLALKLSPCILRPRSYNAMTIQDKHGVRLIQDLLAYKEEIFEDLKRNISTNRPRTNTSSTDESNRRMHMEARQRAVKAAALANGSTSPRPISPVCTTERGRSHQSQFGTVSPNSERSSHRISTGSARSLTHGSSQQTALVSPPLPSVIHETPPSSSQGHPSDAISPSKGVSQTSVVTSHSAGPPPEELQNIPTGPRVSLHSEKGNDSGEPVFGAPSKRGSLGRSSHLARRGGAMLSRHSKKDATSNQVGIPDPEGYIDADAAQIRESYAQRNSLEEDKRPSGLKLVDAPMDD